MSNATTRWSRGSGRPTPLGPPLVAPASACRTWPAVDPALARGAVEHALDRLRASLRRHDVAAALLVDPVNVRYATGTSAKSVWTLHPIDRYLLVPAEGEPVLWEYGSAPPELTSPHPGLATRTATSWAVFGSGEQAGARAASFAADLVAVLRDRGIRDGRIGVDRPHRAGRIPGRPLPHLPRRPDEADRAAAPAVRAPWRSTSAPTTSGATP